MEKETKMSTTIQQVSAQKISELTGYTPERIAIIKAQVAKGTTDAELAHFASVCVSADLDPLLKEIWCYKDYKGNLLIFPGRDGFLKIAQRSSKWNGMTSFDICENDEIDMTINTNNIEINHKPNFKDRGKIIGAYCMIKPKDCDLPIIEYVEFDKYYKGKKYDGSLIKTSPWNTAPAAMIKKVAESAALKKAFGITGLDNEYDFEIKNEIAEPIQDAHEVDELEVLKGKIIDKLEEYKGEDIEEKRQMLKDTDKAGQFTIEFGENLLKQIS